MNQLKFFIYSLSVLFIISCNSDSGDPVPTINCNETGPVLTFTITSTSTCVSSDGAISADVVTPEEGLIYTINGSAAQDNGLFEGLSAGTYTVEVVNIDGCTDSEQITVNSSASTADITDVSLDSQAGCQTSNGAISITATGEGTILYSVTTSTTPNFQSANVLSGLSAGTYTVTIKDDNGCTDQSSISILNGTSYNSEVEPIILANCAITGCHNGDNGADRNWTIFSNVQNRAEAIKSRTQSGSMPPSSRPDLTPGQIALIACWVDDGARNN